MTNDPRHPTRTSDHTGRRLHSLFLHLQLRRRNAHKPFLRKEEREREKETHTTVDSCSSQITCKRAWSSLHSSCPASSITSCTVGIAPSAPRIKSLVLQRQTKEFAAKEVKRRHSSAVMWFAPAIEARGEGQIWLSLWSELVTSQRTIVRPLQRHRGQHVPRVLGVLGGSKLDVVSSRWQVWTVNTSDETDPSEGSLTRRTGVSYVLCLWVIHIFRHSSHIIHLFCVLSPRHQYPSGVWTNCLQGISLDGHIRSQTFHGIFGFNFRQCVQNLPKRDPVITGSNAWKWQTSSSTTTFSVKTLASTSSTVGLRRQSTRVSTTVRNPCYFKQRMLSRRPSTCMTNELMSA